MFAFVAFNHTVENEELKVDVDGRSEGTDIEESFSPNNKDMFDLPLSHSPPEPISPSHEKALQEEISPVYLGPDESATHKILLGASPSDFIIEEDEENVGGSSLKLTKLLYDGGKDEGSEIGQTPKGDSDMDQQEGNQTDDVWESKQLETFEDRSIEDMQMDESSKDDLSHEEPHYDFVTDTVGEGIEEGFAGKIKVEENASLPSSPTEDDAGIKESKAALDRSELMSFDNIAFEGSFTCHDKTDTTFDTEEKSSPDYENIDVVKAFEIQNQLNQIAEVEEESDGEVLVETCELNTQETLVSQDTHQTFSRDMSISSESSAGKMEDIEISMDELQEKMTNQPFIPELESEEFQNVEESEDEEVVKEDPFLVVKHTSDQVSGVSTQEDLKQECLTDFEGVQTITECKPLESDIDVKGEILTDEDSGTIERIDSVDRPDFASLGGNDTPIQDQLLIDVEEPHEAIKEKHDAAVIDSILIRRQDNVLLPDKPQFPQDFGPEGFQYSTFDCHLDEDISENKGSENLSESDKINEETTDVSANIEGNRDMTGDFLQVASDRVLISTLHQQSLGSIDRTESASLDSEDMDEPYGDQKEEMHLEMQKDIAPSPQPPWLPEDEEVFQQDLEDSQKIVDDIDHQKEQTTTSKGKTSVTSSSSDTSLEPTLIAATYDLDTGAVSRVVAAYDVSPDAVEKTVAVETKPRAILSSPEDEVFDDEQKVKVKLQDDDDDEFDEKKLGSLQMKEDTSEERHSSEEDSRSVHSPFELIEENDLEGYDEYLCKLKEESKEKTDIPQAEACSLEGEIPILDGGENSPSLASPVSSGEYSEQKSPGPVDLSSSLLPNLVQSNELVSLDSGQPVESVYVHTNGPTEVDFHEEYDDPFRHQEMTDVDETQSPSAQQTSTSVLVGLDIPVSAEEQSTTIDESIPVDSKPAPQPEPFTDDHGRQDPIEEHTVVTESSDEKLRASEQTLYDLEMPSEEVQLQQEETRIWEQDESFETQIDQTESMQNIEEMGISMDVHEQDEQYLEYQSKTPSSVHGAVPVSNEAAMEIQYEHVSDAEIENDQKERFSKDDKFEEYEDLINEEEEPELIALAEDEEDDNMDISQHSEDQSYDNRNISPIEDRFQFEIDDLDADRPKSPEPILEEHVHREEFVTPEKCDTPKDERRSISVDDQELELRASEFVNTVLKEAKQSVILKLSKEGDLPTDMDPEVIQQVQRKLSKSSGYEESEVHRQLEPSTSSSESDDEIEIKESIVTDPEAAKQVPDDIPEITVTQHLHTETHQDDYPTSYAQAREESEEELKSDSADETEVSQSEIIPEETPVVDEMLDETTELSYDSQNEREETPMDIEESESDTKSIYRPEEELQSEGEGKENDHFLVEGSDAPKEGMLTAGNQDNTFGDSGANDELSARDTEDEVKLIDLMTESEIPLSDGSTILGQEDESMIIDPSLTDKDLKPDTVSIGDVVSDREMQDLLGGESEGETSSVDSFATVVPVTQDEDEQNPEEHEDRLADIASMTSSICSEIFDDQPVEAIVSIDVRDITDEQEIQDEDDSSSSDKCNTSEGTSENDIKSPVLSEQLALISEEGEDEDELTIEIPVYREHMELSVIQEESEEEKRKSTSTSSSDKLDGISSSSSEKLAHSPDVPPSPGALEKYAVKKFNKSAERDDVSISSSLLEFEILESQVVQSSLDSIQADSESSKPIYEKSGQSDVSLSSSLAEFELMESVVVQSVSLEQVPQEKIGRGDSGSLSSLAEFEKLEKEIKTDSDSLEVLSKPSSDDEKIGSISDIELERKSFTSSSSSLDEFERLEQEVIIDEELEAEAQKVVNLLESGALMQAGNEGKFRRPLGSTSELEDLSLSKEQLIDFTDMPRDDSVSSLEEKASAKVEKVTVIETTEEDECPPEIEKIIKQASKNVESFDFDKQAAAHLTDTMAAMQTLLQEQPNAKSEAGPVQASSPVAEISIGLIPAEIVTTELDEDSLKDEDSITCSAPLDSDSLQDPDSVMQVSAESFEGDQILPDLSYDALPDYIEKSPEDEGNSVAMQQSADSLTLESVPSLQRSVDSLGETDMTESLTQDDLRVSSHTQMEADPFIASTDSLEADRNKICFDMQASTDSLEAKAPEMQDEMVRSVDSLESGLLPQSESQDSLEKDQFEQEGIMSSTVEKEDLLTIQDKKLYNVMALSVESGAWSQSSSIVSSETLKLSDIDSGQDHEVMEISVDSPGSLSSSEDMVNTLSHKSDTVLEESEAKKPRLEVDQKTDGAQVCDPSNLDTEGNIEPDNSKQSIDEEGNIEQRKTVFTSKSETSRSHHHSETSRTLIQSESAANYPLQQTYSYQTRKESTSSYDDNKQKKGMTYEPGVGKISFTMDSAAGRGWVSRDTVTSIAIEPEIRGGSPAFHSRSSTPTDSSHSDNCYCGPDSSSTSYGKDDTPLGSPMHRGITINMG